MSDPIQSAPSPSNVPEDKQTPAPPADVASEKTDLSKDAENSSSLDVRALTDRALHFLANASNETLGACLVGLSAATYLILGRVGLVLIGVAGGVVLHATWEAHAHATDGAEKGQAPERKRRENGVDVIHRVLDWRDTKSTDGEKSGDHESDLDVKLSSGKALDYSDFRPETAAALTELTDAIIRDYVKYVGDLLSIYRSNAAQMVVFPDPTFRRLVPKCKPSNVDRILNLRLFPSLPKATCRQLRRLRDALLVLHDHFFPRAVGRGPSIPG
jgi:hypothetical protein